MLMLPRFDQKRSFYLVILCAFYLSFSLSIGVIWAGDSLWYLSGSMRVSPLYPLILKLLRLLFSENAYPYVLIALQQILLAYAIFSFTDMMEREMRLSWYWRAASCAWLAFMLYAFRLLIIGGDTETFFCNAVLTEGITYPLYLLFVKYWFLAVKRRSYLYLLSAAAFSLLLTSTRGQFYWLLIALLAGLIAVWRKSETRSVRAVWLKALAAAAAYALLAFGISAAYHATANGSAAGTTLGAEVTLTAALYDCDEEAIAFLPEGSEEAIVLGATLKTAEQNGWTVNSASGGVIAKYRHYESYYDEIRIEYLQQLSNYYGAGDYHNLPSGVLAQSARRYAALLPRLIGSCFPQYVQTRLINALAGVVRANSIMNLPGILLSAAVYLVCAVFLFLSRRKEAYGDARLLLTGTLLFIGLNALFCCFGVFALSRYMYYNFPLLYYSLLLFVFVFIRERGKAKAGITA